MKLLNTVKSSTSNAANAQPQGFFFEQWPYLLASLIVFLLLLLLWFLVKKRWTRGNKSAAAKIDTSAPALPVSSLVQIWKGFLREIPWDLRRALKIYQHFIVLGEFGSGKSYLINNHTDWQGHARQFYPSYTRNPLLRIYLGSKILVQEIPASLLNDTSKNARLALLKLWEPLYRRKDPTVVAVLNGLTLKNDDPEYLKKEAQVIRGKINLLARIRRKPITVRLALSHMDQVEGFSEFAQFLSENNIPLKLEFNSKDDLKNLAHCLEPYEDYLERALTALPADKYLKVITFMRMAPKFFKDLAVFVTILQNPDPLSPKPKVAALCLASLVGGHLTVANPFATTLTAAELQKFNPLFRHRVAAVALGLVGIIFLGNAFFYEKNLIEEKFEEIVMLEASPPAQYDQKMHYLFVDPLTSMQKHTLMAVLPDFFPHINDYLDRRGIENIRKFYLLPELNRFYVDETEMALTAPLRGSFALKQLNIEEIRSAQQKVLYLLGLIYATRKNELGKLVLKNPVPWSETLGLSQLLIEDYVNNNQSSWPVTLDIERVTYRQAKSLEADLHPWMLYFTKITRLYQQPVITKEDFRKLQKETDFFLGVIRDLDRFDLSARVAELLKKESIHGVRLEVIDQETSQLRQEAIKTFLDLIQGSSIQYPEVSDDLNLLGLYENLKVMLHFKKKGEEAEPLYHFLLGEHEFKFNARLWNDLINRSKITFFLRDFISHNKRHDGLLFFAAGKEFDALALNPFNDGSFLFTGHSIVDGRFTRDAFEKRVQPVLTQLPAFIEQLPIPENDKVHFANFLFKEMEVYANAYAEAYREYYLDFDVTAKSSGALRYVLTHLTLPASQFMDLLLSIRENTALNLDQNEYLRPMALRLGEFEFFQRLMMEQKGAFPELDKYKALLEQMQREIEQQDTTAAGEGSQERKESFPNFRSSLTPLGRISFSIYQDEENSYLNLIRLWLKSVGISAQWQDIFLAPVYQAFALGKPEVESVLENMWSDLWQADVAPLYNQFPFKVSSEQDVLPQTLKNTTHPYGHFWKTFNEFMAPICLKEGGEWKARPGALGEVKLPGNMLQTVNAIERLSTTLWSKDGEAQPLDFMLRPLPLPAAAADKIIPSLSYIHAGGASLFGFNQQPSWKRFSFQWEIESTATVGLEYTTKNKKERIQRAVAVPKAYWSFYHLLQETEELAAVNQFYDAARGAESAWSFQSTDGRINQGSSQTMTWLIASSPSKKYPVDELPVPGRLAERKDLAVKFSIQEDPWAPFRLPPRD